MYHKTIQEGDFKEDTLKMAELMMMIKGRQGNESMTAYARKIGVSEAALSRYYSAKREINVAALRKFSAFYLQQGDDEMLAALISYATGINNKSSSVLSYGDTDARFWPTRDNPASTSDWG